MVWNDNGSLVGNFHAVTTERRQASSEQPARARWADGHETQVGVERGSAFVPCGDAEVDPWCAGQRVEQRLEQATTGASSLRSWKQVHMEVGRKLGEHLWRRDRRVMDVAVEPSVGRQVTIIGWVDVAGAQRGPPPRLALGPERDRVLGPDDVTVDTGVVLGDEGEVRAQGEVCPGPDLARQVMVDIERGGVAAGVRGTQTHVVDRVAIAGFSASDAHPDDSRRRP